MKYAILAAGRGLRLDPLTKEIPKCLIKYKGKPIVFHFLDNLLESDEIFIIVGYLKEKVISEIKQNYPHLNITFITNDEPLQSGTSHSLWLARKHLSDGFVYANGDIIPDKRIFEDLKNADNVMFIDNNRLFRNNIIKFSPEAARALFSLNHVKQESAFDRIFKMIGEFHFKSIDITDYDWQEIDAPEDLSQ